MGLPSTMRRAVDQAAAGSPAASEDGTALKPYPQLQAFLRETAWDDGTARQTATLMIFAEDGRWKAMLNDRQEGCVCFVSGECVSEALKSLEKGLSNASLDWRMSRQGPSKGKRS